MGFLMYEHRQEESTIDVLIVYWCISDLKARAPSSALPSAFPVQRGIAFHSPDHAGLAKSGGTIQTYMVCEK